MNFIQMMIKCIPVAVQLLGSKVISDVLESLEFLSVAFEFQVCGSREGVRKALALVWSREQQVKDAVVNMYVRLYFNPQVRKTYVKPAGSPYITDKYHTLRSLSPVVYRQLSLMLYTHVPVLY